MIPSFEELREGDLATQVSQQCGPGRTRVGVRETNTGLLMPEKYKVIAQKIQDFEVREDDLWLMSWVKTGTTWMSELVWLLKHIDNIEEALAAKRVHRHFFLEYECLEGPKLSTIEDLNELPSPRFLKTHLPVQLLPRQLWTKKPKIIYIARNPKDTAVSLYHFYVHLFGYTGSKEMLFEAVAKDKVIWSPFWKNLLEFWDLRKEDYVLFTTYEEMSKDLKGVVERVASFLDVTVSKENMAKLLHHLSFSNMKTNRRKVYESMGKEELWKDFLRKGKTGEGEKEMSPEIHKLFDEWTDRNLAGTGFPLSLITP